MANDHWSAAMAGCRLMPRGSLRNLGHELRTKGRGAGERMSIISLKSNGDRNLTILALLANGQLANPLQRQIDRAKRQSVRNQG